MKPILLQILNDNFNNISVPFKIEKIEESKTPLGSPILCINIVFPGVYSKISVVIPGEKSTGKSGFAIVIQDKKNDKRKFLVGDYLTYKKLPGKDKFVFDTKNTNYVDGFNNALSYLVNLYDGPLKDILLGNTWEDIPFDWMGYR
jgi:hypothetical protein